MIRARTILPWLMLLSGFCGISYEILYAKLLGNLLGDRFTISASVLLTFLLGIGLGTLHAHRLLRWLWAVEAGIGLYAVALVSSYATIDRLLYAWVPRLGTSLLVCAAVSVVLLLAPAFLVGCSVPLFAGYMAVLRRKQVFSVSYGLYNLGAALTALVLEFALLRSLGLQNATLLLASLNLVVAFVLLALRRELVPVVAVPQEAAPFARRVLAALALASVASAIFQLLMLKVAECVLGPFNETFALVLAVVLIGLSVGSWAVLRFKLTFDGALLAALSGLAALFVLFPFWIGAYAASFSTAVEHPATLAGLKLVLVTALMGLPAIGFGATVPALLREYRNVARESGRLLWISSMANVVGFVLMAFVLHERLSYGQLLLLVVGITAVGLALHAWRRWLVTAVAAALLLLAVGVERFAWDEELLYYGHKEFHSAARFERAREQGFEVAQFKGPHDLFAIIERDGRPFFFINGYISIALTAASEKLVGALSTMFAPRTDDALVLGVGSGATAGTVGLLFDRTDAVEINRTVLDHLDLMAEYNFRILHQPTVNLIHDDGIHFIKTTPKRYSLILNTVTSPLYFSSSKLYTEDFYESVVARLKPDGVYTTWIDRAIGDHGVDIILNTLKSSFESCWLTYVKSSYYLMVCSNAEVGLRQYEAVEQNETLREYLAVRHGIPLELLPYSVLSPDAFRFSSQRTPTNRLDHPVLEHHMAALDGEARLFRLSDNLIERANLAEVRRALEPSFDWDVGGFSLWADLRLSDASLLAGALREVVDRQFGDVSEEYARAALASVRGSAAGEVYEKVGRELVDRELCDAAMEAFTGALALDDRLVRSHYYRGLCEEQAGDEAAAEGDYRRALELDPEYDNAREALERLLDDGA